MLQTNSLSSCQVAAALKDDSTISPELATPNNLLVNSPLTADSFIFTITDIIEALKMKTLHPDGYIGTIKALKY